jgi:hypothetical protein
MRNYLELFKFHDSISFGEPIECMHISKIKPKNKVFIYLHI